MLLLSSSLLAIYVLHENDHLWRFPLTKLLFNTSYSYCDVYIDCYCAIVNDFVH